MELLFVHLEQTYKVFHADKDCFLQGTRHDPTSKPLLLMYLLEVFPVI